MLEVDTAFPAETQVVQGGEGMDLISLGTLDATQPFAGLPQLEVGVHEAGEEAIGTDLESRNRVAKNGKGHLHLPLEPLGDLVDLLRVLDLGDGEQEDGSCLLASRKLLH